MRKKFTDLISAFHVHITYQDTIFWNTLFVYLDSFSGRKVCIKTFAKMQTLSRGEHNNLYSILSIKRSGQTWYQKCDKNKVLQP